MLQMKWFNINIAIRIKLSDGAMWLIAIVAYLSWCFMSKFIPAISSNFIAGSATFAGILWFGLKHEDAKNKLDFDAAEKNIGDRISQIKMDARKQGTPPPPPSPDQNTQK